MRRVRFASSDEGFSLGDNIVADGLNVPFVHSQTYNKQKFEYKQSNALKTEKNQIQ